MSQSDAVLAAVCTDGADAGIQLDHHFKRAVFDIIAAVDAPGVGTYRVPPDAMTCDDGQSCLPHGDALMTKLPAWVEFISSPDLLGIPKPYPCGALFDIVDSGAFKGAVSGRFVCTADSEAVVIPGRVLIDLSARGSGLSAVDRLRTAHGLLSARDASEAELRRMDSQFVCLDDGYGARCVPSASHPACSDDLRQDARTWEPADLRTALAATAIQVTAADLALFSNDRSATLLKVASDSFGVLVAHGPRTALKLLRALNRMAVAN